MVANFEKYFISPDFLWDFRKVTKFQRVRSKKRRGGYNGSCLFERQRLSRKMCGIYKIRRS